MDDNKPQGWPDQKPGSFPPTGLPGQGGPMPARPTPPPPPPPEITLRTMKSDLEALKQTGGASTAPKPFTPPELKTEISRPTPPPPPPPPPLPKITPSAFETKKPDAVKPGSSIIEEETATAGEKTKAKKVLLWIVVAVVAAGVGLIAYFFIYPLFFPSQLPPPPAVTSPTPTTPSTAETPATPELKQHISLLQSPNETVNKNLSDIELLSITKALQEESQTQRPVENLVEIAFSGSNGQIDASVFLPALLPELPASLLQPIFEKDFTAALYYDTNGVWPIYLLKLNFDTSISETQTVISALESSANLSNLFLAAPGMPSAAGFKSGQVNGIATRYLTYSQKGAALNSAWVNDTFVISTSYNGLKKLLGNIK